MEVSSKHLPRFWEAGFSSPSVATTGPTTTSSNSSSGSTSSSNNPVYNAPGSPSSIYNLGQDNSNAVGNLPASGVATGSGASYGWGWPTQSNYFYSGTGSNTTTVNQPTQINQPQQTNPYDSLVNQLKAAAGVQGYSADNPITWQQASASVYGVGKYYDTSGKIQGAVDLNDLGKYGYGRIVDLSNPTGYSSIDQVAKQYGNMDLYKQGFTTFQSQQAAQQQQLQQALQSQASYAPAQQQTNPAQLNQNQLGALQNYVNLSKGLSGNAGQYQQANLDMQQWVRDNIDRPYAQYDQEIRGILTQAAMREAQSEIANASDLNHWGVIQAGQIANGNFGPMGSPMQARTATLPDGDLWTTLLSQYKAQGIPVSDGLMSYAALHDAWTRVVMGNSPYQALTPDQGAAMSMGFGMRGTSFGDGTGGSASYAYGNGGVDNYNAWGTYLDPGGGYSNAGGPDAFYRSIHLPTSQPTPSAGTSVSGRIVNTGIPVQNTIPYGGSTSATPDGIMQPIGATGAYSPPVYEGATRDPNSQPTFWWDVPDGYTIQYDRQTGEALRGYQGDLPNYIPETHQYYDQIKDAQWYTKNTGMVPSWGNMQGWNKYIDNAKSLWGIF